MVYKFLFDVDRCIDCKACEVACKQQNDVEIGVRWRRVPEIEGGNIQTRPEHFSRSHASIAHVPIAWQHVQRERYINELMVLF